MPFVHSNQKQLKNKSTGYIQIKEMNNEKTMTQQNHAQECDVNYIVAKHQATGVITHVARSNGSYIDTTQIPDYHTALQTVLDAQNVFMELPAQLRKRFANDPAQLLSFLSDPANAEEAISLGLVNSPQPTQTSQTPTQTQTQQTQTPTQNQQNPTTTQPT